MKRNEVLKTYKYDTYIQYLFSWSHMFNKKEDIFAATNGSPDATAVDFSLQV